MIGYNGEDKEGKDKDGEDKYDKDKLLLICSKFLVYFENYPLFTLKLEMINNKVCYIDKFKDNPVIECIIGYNFDTNYNELTDDNKNVILKLLLIIDSDLERHRTVLSISNKISIISKTDQKYKESLSYKSIHI